MTEPTTKEIRLGNRDGRTNVEVTGGDFGPGDKAGWMAQGKRTRPLNAESKAGESTACTGRQSRPRERAEYTRRGTKRITRAARMPPLPREKAKIIVRPRGGLKIARTDATAIMAAVVAAAQISKEESRLDTVCLTPTQNIIVVSTSSQERAMKHKRMKELIVGDTTHVVCTYRAAPEETAKGVIRWVDITPTDEEINENVVNDLNPTALQAHRIGMTSAV